MRVTESGKGRKSENERLVVKNIHTGDRWEMGMCSDGWVCKAECVSVNGGKFACVACVAVIVLLTGSVDCFSFLGKQARLWD